MPDPAPHRVGQPSPLIFHLTAALTTYGHALLAAPRAGSPRFPWAPGLAESAAALGADLDQVEVAREIARRLSATVEGLEVWQRHPYRRQLQDPPAIWAEGSSRLLDFGRARGATAPDGPPVLVVPSLINKPYVLDLLPGLSLLRWLAGEGFRPVLIDWGAPGLAERDFDLGTYGAERLLPAFEHLHRSSGRPVAVLGYCMGGTMAVGLTAQARGGVACLATIGAPWDFASTEGVAGGLRQMIRAEGPERVGRLLDGLGEALGMVPVTLFQMLFALVNPIQAALKFQKLSRLDPDGPAARLFVALEDWLADGVPMPVGAAKDLLLGWQIRNLTALGAWRFLGGAVNPGIIGRPALIFCGEGDTIAPPPLAVPLGAAIPGARLVRPRTGHVGMVVGSAARAQVWRPMAEFLARHTG